jgi:hypothetical protein
LNHKSNYQHEPKKHTPTTAEQQHTTCSSSSTDPLFANLLAYV